MPAFPNMMLAQLTDSKPLPLHGDSGTMIFPLVVNEEQVSPFTYWHGEIRQGICYNHELYAHFETHSVYDRLKAYDIAFEQSSQGMAVCITVSKTHYKIWLSLRSLSRTATHDRLSVT